LDAAQNKDAAPLGTALWDSSDFNGLASRGKVMLGEWQTKPSKWLSYGWFYILGFCQTHQITAI
jgi:hypothetical protein